MSSSVSSPASVKEYFSRSPFRSLSFDVATASVVFFTLASVKATHDASAALRPSAATFGLTLLPAAVWAFSLLLHWEVRAVLDLWESPRSFSQLADLHLKRLAGLHCGLVVGVAIISYGIMQGLLMTVR